MDVLPRGKEKMYQIGWTKQHQPPEYGLASTLIWSLSNLILSVVYTFPLKTDLNRGRVIAAMKPFIEAVGFFKPIAA